jgi:Ca2+/H+ antiporter, TMEM165/GDT1 family
MIDRRRMRKLLVLLPIGIVAIALFGYVVMSLWNGLVPPIFGGRVITFWQALGILVLSRILFGGFFGRRSREQRRARIIDKWERMTPEEREKFRAGMRSRCGGTPQTS